MNSMELDRMIEEARSRYLRENNTHQLVIELIRTAQQPALCCGTTQ